MFIAKEKKMQKTINKIKNTNKSINDMVNNFYLFIRSSGKTNLLKVNKTKIIILTKLKIKKIIMKAAKGAKLFSIDVELLLL